MLDGLILQWIQHKCKHNPNYSSYLDEVAVLPVNSDQLLSDQWRAAVHSCRDPLQLERDDLRQILKYDSWSDVQDQLAKSKGDQTIQQEFAMLAHGLSKLKTFSHSWMCQVSSDIETSAIWGFMWLVLKVGRLSLLAIILYQEKHEIFIKIFWH